MTGKEITEKGKKIIELHNKGKISRREKIDKLVEIDYYFGHSKK